MKADFWENQSTSRGKLLLRRSGNFFWCFQSKIFMCCWYACTFFCEESLSTCVQCLNSPNIPHNLQSNFESESFKKHASVFMFF